MNKQQKKKFLLITGILLAVLLILIFVVGSPGEKTETISEVMRDGVLHESNKIRFLGLEVNPAVLSDVIVVAALLIAAVLIRVFAVPRFKTIPGKFQLVIEQLVGMFDSMGKKASPHRNQLLGGYLFFAAVFIFTSTCFELLGVQAVTTTGRSISLPAPLADINGAIAMGCLSYGFIMSGGIASNGVKGVGLTLKEFSLPISMSFRLFGALLSGMLVTELVYYTLSLSFVLPVIVAILFTLMHALIQSYVLTMLTSTFYGEVSEPSKKKKKDKARKTVKSRPAKVVNEA